MQGCVSSSQVPLVFKHINTLPSHSFEDCSASRKPLEPFSPSPSKANTTFSLRAFLSSLSFDSAFCNGAPSAMRGSNTKTCCDLLCQGTEGNSWQRGWQPGLDPCCPSRHAHRGSHPFLLIQKAKQSIPGIPFLGQHLPSTAAQHSYSTDVCRLHIIVAMHKNCGCKRAGLKFCKDHRVVASSCLNHLGLSAKGFKQCV